MKIVVQGATLKCSHQGTGLLPSGNAKLKIGGKPAVVAGMELGVAFPNCTFATGAGPSPCAATLAATAGISTKLKVDGLGVLLDSATGTATNPQDPSATWSVDDTGQTLLEEK